MTTPTITPTSSTFEGADVDGLDRLAQEFQQGAQVVAEVKAAVEAIIAAASIFGPFGAAFVAYLRAVVVPWLTAINQALTAMGQLLSLHSQAQKDASSSATSLPSYQSATTPTTSTGAYPTIGQLAGVALAGALALTGLGSSTAVTSLIGAVGGSPTAGTAEGAEKAETAEKPEQIAPHTAEVGQNFGTLMNKDNLEDAELEELGVPKGSSIHPTTTLDQTGFDKAVATYGGGDATLEVLQAKGGAAAFAGFDPTSGGQLGVAGNIGLNAADLKLTTGPLGLGGLGTVTAGDETTVGLNAQGSAVAAYNPATQTASLSAGAEATAGLQTKATITYVDPSGYFTNTTELTGTLGASAAANGAIVVSPGQIDIHGGVGAALGLGGHVADDLDINYGKMATDAYNATAPIVTTTVNEIGSAATSAETTIGSWFAPTPPVKH